jgi:exodeoxyribonuclease V alpha subunit
VNGSSASASPVGEDTCIYLAALYHAEVQLANRIRRLAAGQHPWPAIDIEKALAWVEKQVRLQLAQAQLAAVALAAKAKVLIITGGPGVGKTTIVNSILKIFTAKRLPCVLCAPTGRAAKWMTEATGCEAKTIHRLLEFNPENYGFKRNADNPLEAALVLLDEVSMMDLPLAYALVQAVPENAALILVGNVDQLASVGSGAVLSDLIASEAFPTVRLSNPPEDSWRSSAPSPTGLGLAPTRRGRPIRRGPHHDLQLGSQLLPTRPQTYAQTHRVSGSSSALRTRWMLGPMLTIPDPVAIL